MNRHRRVIGTIALATSPSRQLAEALRAIDRIHAGKQGEARVAVADNETLWFTRTSIEKWLSPGRTIFLHVAVGPRGHRPAAHAEWLTPGEAKALVTRVLRDSSILDSEILRIRKRRHELLR